MNGLFWLFLLLSIELKPTKEVKTTFFFFRNKKPTKRNQGLKFKCYSTARKSKKPFIISNTMSYAYPQMVRL